MMLNCEITDPIQVNMDGEKIQKIWIGKSFTSFPTIPIIIFWNFSAGPICHKENET